MKATKFEFRFRYLIHTVIFTVCFLVPWRLWKPQGGASTLWTALSMESARHGVASFAAASTLIAIMGMLAAFAGAGLRTWGGAYLGSAVVQDAAMCGGIVADGPYRHFRNPLYLGTWLHTLGLALIMPPIGGVAAVLLIGLFQLRLIAAEETFLSSRCGHAYAAYCALVPRLLPSIKPRVPASGAPPRWLPSILGESYFWLFAISFSVLAWRYDTLLLYKGLLISLGVSLIVNAAFPAKRGDETQQA